MLTHLTDTLTTLITNLYVSTGLLGILLAMAIESCCIPLPSEIVMPLAGIMIGSGKLLPGTNPIVSIILVALAGSVGSLLGSTVAYAIGYKGGRPLMLKYGRYVLISQHDADKADQFFQRWGSATAFFSRLLPVVRTYISLPAGISKMPFVKFAIYTFLGSFPWCVALAYAGTVLGNNLATLSPIFHSLDVVILVVFVLLVVLYIWRHVRNDRKARAAHTAEAQGQPGQQGQPQQQQWGQPSYPQQQWSQQGQPGQPGQQQWGQPQPMQPQPPQPQWNQPGQAPYPQQQWAGQPSMQPQTSQWGQPGQPQHQQQVPGPQPQQQQWGQPAQPPYPQSWPPQADDDRTVYRR